MAIEEPYIHPCNLTATVSSLGCDSAAEHVTEIALRGLGLQGTIPSELGAMADLKKLDLSDNKLSGTIPPTHVLWKDRLELLSLEYNFLSGTLPPTLAYDGEHALVDGPPATLQLLRLGENSLSGSLPSWLGLLTSLRDLSLHTTLVSGAIPTQLGALVELRYLGLGATRLPTGEGLIPTELGLLQKMKSLCLPLPPELRQESPSPDGDDDATQCWGTAW